MDQITILSKHLHKNFHELTILSCSNTPKITSTINGHTISVCFKYRDHKGTTFKNRDFISWLHQLGITYALRTTYLPWTNGKMEIQNKHLGTHFRNFFDQAKENWSGLAAKFAFAHNTTINASTGLTPYEIVFGRKPQIPISLKLGLLRNSE